MKIYLDVHKEKGIWNEEDKRKINRIYSILGQAADTHAFSTTCRLISDKECVELQDFLKAINERYTWKPSDEQIYFLHWFATNVLTDGEVDKKASEVLESLYQELKKLREE